MKTLYNIAFALLVFSRVWLNDAHASDYAPQPISQPVVYYRSPTYYGAYVHKSRIERHYYPFTGKKPKVGRLEGRDMLYLKPKAGKKYEREWTAAPDYAADYYDDREEEQRTRRQPIYIQPIIRGFR
jgi:hypothetical protein